ncbi:MAG: 16S rRNA (guanine(527)-N(7))-methyltransferase RsmG [Elusimicrobiota bacterium]
MPEPSALDPALALEPAAAKWSALLEPLGAAPGSAVLGRLLAYLSELKAWNENVNLISYQCDEELLLGHLLDSLMVLEDPALPAAARCVDVGSGGGLPGFPLRLARPGWAMTFVESIQKKAAFLQAAADKFSLDDCRVEAARAEDLAREPAHREAYDLAFFRAVGDFSMGLELTLPFLKIGGACLAHRGADGPQEADAAAEALKILGGEVVGRRSYRLPHRDKERWILRVEKRRPTPPEYPRRPGVPAKRPL